MVGWDGGVRSCGRGFGGLGVIAGWFFSGGWLWLGWRGLGVIISWFFGGGWW